MSPHSSRKLNRLAVANMLPASGTPERAQKAGSITRGVAKIAEQVVYACLDERRVVHCYDAFEVRLNY